MGGCIIRYFPTTHFATFASSAIFFQAENPCFASSMTFVTCSMLQAREPGECLAVAFSGAFWTSVRARLEST